MATVYISPGANIKNAANALSSGDTLILRDGVYTTTSTQKITQGNITIKAQNKWGAILDGNYSGGRTSTPNDQYHNMMFIDGANGVTIDGLYFRRGRARLLACQYADNLTVRNCKFIFSYRQLLVYRKSNGGKIYNNYFELGSQVWHEYRPDTKGNKWAGAVEIKVEVDGCEFAYNVIYNTAREGTNIGKDAKNVIVHHNHYVNCERLGGYFVACQNSEAYSNYIYHTKNFNPDGAGTGWELRDETQYSERSNANKLYNNFFVDLRNRDGAGTSAIPVTWLYNGNNTFISHNTVVDVSTGITLMAPGDTVVRGENNYCRNNLLYDCNKPVSREYGNNRQSETKFKEADNISNASLVAPNTTISDWPETRTNLLTGKRRTWANPDPGDEPWNDYFDVSNYHQAGGSSSINTVAKSTIDKDYRGARRQGAADAGAEESGAAPPPTTYDISANFTISDSTISEGDSVTFTNTTTTAGGAVDDVFLWSYNQGSGWFSFSTNENPTRTFTSAGEYQIRLIATDGVNNQSDTKIKSISVAEAAPSALVASFAASDLTPDEDDAVTLTNQTTGGSAPYTYTWSDNAGNGGAWFSSTSATSPTWTPTTAGTYVITLSVDDDASASDSTALISVVSAVVTVNDVAADFTLSATSAAVGDTITLTDASTDFGTGNVDTWLWEVSQDGGLTRSTISTAQGPHNHLIEYPGTTTFFLTVTDSVGGYSDNTTQIVTVDEKEHTNNLVSNGFFPTEGVSTPWAYTQGSGGDSDISVWDADADGDNELRVRCVDAASGDELYQTGISVTEGASYELSFNAFCRHADSTMTVEVTSSSGATIHIQDIASMTGEAQRFSYLFSAEETAASARLSFSDFEDLTNYFIDSIQIIPAGDVPTLAASFSVSTDNPQLNGSVTFTDQSTGLITGWSWTATGATELTSIAQGPTFTFDESGPQTVTLTITDSYGATSTVSQTIYVAVGTPSVEVGANPQIDLDAFDTSTSDQVFTWPTAYETAPAGAIVIASGSTTIDLEAADAHLMIGATDGTNEWAYALFADDAAATSLTRARGVKDATAISIDGSGVTGKAALSALSTTGLTLSVSDAFPATYQAAAIALPYKNVAVGVVDVPASEGGTDTVALGWNPQSGEDNTLVLFFANDSNFDDTQTGAELSIGVLTDSDILTRYYKSGTGSAPGGVTHGRVDTTSIAWSALTVDVDWSVSGALTDSGFLITKDNGTASGKEMAYIAINAGTRSIDAQTFVNRTTTGIDNIEFGESLGFAMILGSMLPSLDVTGKFVDSSVISVSAVDTAGESFTAAITDEDKADPTDAESLMSSDFEVPQGDGTAGLRATATINGSRLELNYSNVTSAVQQIFIGIGAAESSGSSDHDPVARNATIGLAKGLN